MKGGKLAAGGAPAVAGSAASAIAGAGDGQQPIELPQRQRLVIPAPSGPQIDISQIEGQVKDSSVKKIGEVVTNHPEESVAILRNWLQQTD